MAIEQLAEEVVNEVATNLEEAAEVTRKLNTAGLSYFAVGLGVGAAIGFYFGYKFNREKIRAEVYAEAKTEVDVLRQVYLEKMFPEDEKGNDSPPEGALIDEKPAIEEVVESLGYGGRVPARERPLPPPVPILDDLPENPVGTSKSMNAGWNYEQELQSRDPEKPYVIHQNEYNHSNLNYSKVAYTYYAMDDFLIDEENDRPVLNGDQIVGVENLKFGHGSDDSEVVYVRNDVRELDMQISRLNRSYEEEGLGLDGPSRENDDDDDHDS